jgi:hypothetical protein
VFEGEGLAAFGVVYDFFSGLLFFRVLGEEQKLIFMFNFRSRSIPWLVLFLDHIINFSELINTILIVGLDNEHAALDKALPVLAIRMQGSGHF